MSNNGILDLIDIREQVADSFVAQMVNSSPARQERILRMLINRMSRSQIDILFIAQNLYGVDTVNTSPAESEEQTRD